MRNLQDRQEVHMGRKKLLGKYVIKKVNTGYKFVLHARNGKVVLDSEVYTTEQACIKGTDSIRRNAPVANIQLMLEEPYEHVKNPKFEIYIDKAGQYRFRLKAKNGEIIGTSEAYKAKANALIGARSIMKNAPTTEIVKLY